MSIIIQLGSFGCVRGALCAHDFHSTRQPILKNEGNLRVQQGLTKLPLRKYQISTVRARGAAQSERRMLRGGLILESKNKGEMKL